MEVSARVKIGAPTQPGTESVPYEPAFWLVLSNVGVGKPHPAHRCVLTVSRSGFFNLFTKLLVNSILMSLLLTVINELLLHRLLYSCIIFKALIRILLLLDLVWYGMVYVDLSFHRIMVGNCADWMSSRRSAFMNHVRGRFARLWSNIMFVYTLHYAFTEFHCLLCTYGCWKVHLSYHDVYKLAAWRGFNSMALPDKV